MSLSSSALGAKVSKHPVYRIHFICLINDRNMKMQYIDGSVYHSTTCRKEKQVAAVNMKHLVYCLVQYVMWIKVFASVMFTR